MAIYKNVASQKIAVYAFDAAGDPVTGDAANITAQISKDAAASAATNDANPTELDATDHPGIYIFDLTQAETNADLIVLSAVSATVDVFLDPLQILTLPGDNAAINANLTEIDASSDAAIAQKNAALGVYAGSITGASPTTTTFVDAGLTSGQDDNYVGRVVIFTSGACRHQAREITDFVASTDTLTFTALTTAPAQTDNYVIV